MTGVTRWKTLCATIRNSNVINDDSEELNTILSYCRYILLRKERPAAAEKQCAILSIF